MAVDVTRRVNEAKPRSPPKFTEGYRNNKRNGHQFRTTDLAEEAHSLTICGYR